MKKEDFERLKAICEKEGFELEISPIWDKTYKISKKKDIWEGVEFAETISCGPIGNIFKIESKNEHDLQYRLRKNGSEGKLYSYTKRAFKPSTEEAYVEQLKKEALERFPNIKEGDILKTDWDIDNVKISKGDIGFEYVKFADMLLYNTTAIYKEGKWAERVKERVKVVKFSNMGDINDNSMRFTFEISGKKIEQFYLYGVSEFLYSQLEKYLNGEIE